MIEVRGLSHSYGSTWALQDLTVRVPDGKVVGLVGPNGAGKTTLMRILSTLLVPTSGEVLVDGISVVLEPTRVRACVGYLPERATPYAELLVWEQLELFADLAGHKGAARAERIDKALHAAGLENKAQSLVRELSKGLRQRLALQSVLMHDPRTLLLDEPTDGLDPESRETLLAQTRQLADQGRAVLLSSHVLGELEQLADQTIILVEGQQHVSLSEPQSLRFALRVREPIAQAKAFLMSSAEVTCITESDGWLIVTLAPELPDASSLIGPLVQAGFSLVELRQEREHLRDRLRAAVQQHAQQGAPQ